MAINKNFVVKNGFEVNTNLIVADATVDKVGIGTTVPRYVFHVNGGIGVTDSYVGGISTVANELRVGNAGEVFSVIAGPSGVGQSVGVGTAFPAYLLDVRSPVSTGQTALYVQGDVRITGDLSVDDITLDDATLSNLTVSEYLYVGNSPGISTFAGFTDFNGSVDINVDLNVVGLTTLGSYVDINDSVDVSGDLNVVGLTTIGGYVDINDSVDISDNLNVVGVTTLATVDINAGDIEVSNVDTTDLNVTGIATIATVDINGGDILVSNVDTTDLNVTGISTLGTVLVSSGVVTATSGIVTYYGDGSYLTGNARNLTATIGVGTTGGVVGYGVSFLDLRGAGVSTALYDGNVGIATIYFEGGGGGSASIGIGSTPGDAFVGVITSGNLWYNTNLGRLFIYYQDTDSAQWVDAAPFNIGIVTSLITSITLAPQTASNPSLSFVGDSTTGLFSPGAGQQTFVSVGSSILNINPSGINVTGIITSTRLITGNINSSGIVTAQDFDALSDQNYKENITTVNNALLKVEQLRGVKFDWKESGTPSYGVIAQELEQVLPELVHGNDPKTVNYNGIIGVLIEAIKELKAEVEELKNAK
jgi:hypothetical protein